MDNFELGEYEDKGIDRHGICRQGNTVDGVGSHVFWLAGWLAGWPASHGSMTRLAHGS